MGVKDSSCIPNPDSGAVKSVPAVGGAGESGSSGCRRAVVR